MPALRQLPTAHALPCHVSHSPLCVAQVMPALRQHVGEFLLKEFLQRWTNHKIMVRWLSRFFNYLDR